MDKVKIEEVIVGNEDIKPPLIPPVLSHPNANLQCFDCLITFIDIRAKERHMRKNHREEYKKQLQNANTLFTCYLCDKSYSSSEELSHHQSSHSPKEKPFLCTDCHTRFLTYHDLNKHKGRECMERKYTCDECGAKFPSRPRLRRHCIAVHPEGDDDDDDDNEETPQCYKCGRWYQTEGELQKHLELIAKGLNCEKKKRGRKPKYLTQEEAPPAGKKIKEEEDTGEYDGCGDSSTKGSRSTQQPKELKIPCPEDTCDLTFPSVAALRAHRKSGHGPLPPKT